MYLKVRAAFGSFHSVRSFGVCMLYDLVFIRVRVGCILFPPEFMATTVFILTSPFGAYRLLWPCSPSHSFLPFLCPGVNPHETWHLSRVWHYFHRRNVLSFLGNFDNSV